MHRILTALGPMVPDVGQIVRLAGVLLIAGALASCAGRGGPVSYNVQNFGSPDILTEVSSTQDYHIGPGDTIGVSVFGVAEFSGDYAVDSIGRIKLPLIGDVSVIGQTGDQVAAAIKSKLQATYLRNPEVQVVMKTTQSLRVTVDGSVNAPGIYAITPQTTLLQIVAQAKGITEDANPRRIVVFRRINGERNAAAFDLREIRRGTQPDPQVYASDIVIVDGNRVTKAFKNIIQVLPFATIFRPF